ncbi:MAG: hypothetical protein WCH04_11230, partial [Gammaproteobacteria bacterium]
MHLVVYIIRSIKQPFTNPAGNPDQSTHISHIGANCSLARDISLPKVPPAVIVVVMVLFFLGALSAWRLWWIMMLVMARVITWVITPVVMRVIRCIITVISLVVTIPSRAALVPMIIIASLISPDGV